MEVATPLSIALHGGRAKPKRKRTPKGKASPKKAKPKRKPSPKRKPKRKPSPKRKPKRKPSPKRKPKRKPNKTKKTTLSPKHVTFHLPEPEDPFNSDDELTVVIMDPKREDEEEEEVDVQPESDSEVEVEVEDIAPVVSAPETHSPPGMSYRPDLPCKSSCFATDKEHGSPWCETQPHGFMFWRKDWTPCVMPEVLNKGLGISADPASPCIDACHDGLCQDEFGEEQDCLGTRAVLKLVTAYMGTIRREFNQLSKTVESAVEGFEAMKRGSMIMGKESMIKMHNLFSQIETMVPAAMKHFDGIVHDVLTRQSLSLRRLTSTSLQTVVMLLQQSVNALYAVINAALAFYSSPTQDSNFAAAKTAAQTMERLRRVAAGIELEREEAPWSEVAEKLMGDLPGKLLNLTFSWGAFWSFFLMGAALVTYRMYNGDINFTNFEGLKKNLLLHKFTAKEKHLGKENSWIPWTFSWGRIQDALTVACVMAMDSSATHTGVMATILRGVVLHSWLTRHILFNHGDSAVKTWLMNKLGVRLKAPRTRGAARKGIIRHSLEIGLRTALFYALTQLVDNIARWACQFIRWINTDIIDISNVTDGIPVLDWAFSEKELTRIGSEAGMFSSFYQEKPSLRQLAARKLNITAFHIMNARGGKGGRREDERVTQDLHNAALRINQELAKANKEAPKASTSGSRRHDEREEEHREDTEHARKTGAQPPPREWSRGTQAGGKKWNKFFQAFRDRLHKKSPRQPGQGLGGTSGTGGASGVGGESGESGASGSAGVGGSSGDASGASGVGGPSGDSHSDGGVGGPRGDSHSDGGVGAPGGDGGHISSGPRRSQLGGNGGDSMTMLRWEVQPQGGRGNTVVPLRAKVTPYGGRGNKTGSPPRRLFRPHADSTSSGSPPRPIGHGVIMTRDLGDVVPSTSPPPLTPVPPPSPKSRLVRLYKALQPETRELLTLDELTRLAVNPFKRARIRTGYDVVLTKPEQSGTALVLAQNVVEVHQTLTTKLNTAPNPNVQVRILERASETMREPIKAVLIKVPAVVADMTNRLLPNPMDMFDAVNARIHTIDTQYNVVKASTVSEPLKQRVFTLLESQRAKMEKVSLMVYPHAVADEMCRELGFDRACNVDILTDGFGDPEVGDQLRLDQAAGLQAMTVAPNTHVILEALVKTATNGAGGSVKEDMLRISLDEAETILDGSSLVLYNDLQNVKKAAGNPKKPSVSFDEEERVFRRVIKISNATSGNPEKPPPPPPPPSRDDEGPTFDDFNDGVVAKLETIMACNRGDIACNSMQNVKINVDWEDKTNIQEMVAFMTALKRENESDGWFTWLANKIVDDPRTSLGEKALRTGRGQARLVELIERSITERVKEKPLEGTLQQQFQTMATRILRNPDSGVLSSIAGLAKDSVDLVGPPERDFAVMKKKLDQVFALPDW